MHRRRKGAQRFGADIAERALAMDNRLPFVVVDDCGLFPTFVGGGPTAF